MAAATLLAQPKIYSIVNTASYLTPPQDSNGNPVGNDVIAEGSIFIVFGAGLGPTAPTYPAGLPLPTTLPASTGTSISISAGGQTIAAYMFYTSALQVQAILPSTTPVGSASVTLSYNGKTSASFTISVMPSRLGIFTSNSQGYGIAAAQHGVGNAADIDVQRRASWRDEWCCMAPAWAPLPPLTTWRRAACRWGPM